MIDEKKKRLSYKGRTVKRKRPAGLIEIEPVAEIFTKVRVDEAYAFHRGKTHLGAVPAPSAAKPKPNAEAAQQRSGKDMLLENIRGQNMLFNRDQRGKYRSLLRNKKQGVEAKAAF